MNMECLHCRGVVTEDEEAILCNCSVNGRSAGRHALCAFTEIKYRGSIQCMTCKTRMHLRDATSHDIKDIFDGSTQYCDRCLRKFDLFVPEGTESHRPESAVWHLIDNATSSPLRFVVLYMLCATFILLVASFSIVVGCWMYDSIQHMRP